MRRVLLACISLVLLALLFYRGILFGVSPEDVPWASDTLGHVLKAEYLRDQVEQGVLYPDFFPHWYMGLQMLRYHPPLPYYMLAGLSYVTGNMVQAANWFIVLCTLAGALTVLLYQRWVGLWPAWIGGIFFLMLPDNVRVAFAEGNLPRVLATAFLPLALYCLVRILEPDGGRRHAVGLAICFLLITLSHAMMAAIYAVCLAVLALLLGLFRATAGRRLLLGIGSIGTGLLLAGWWLLPSLTGGITTLDAEALTQAQAVFPLLHFLNPFVRQENPEYVYVGAVLLLVSLLGVFVREGRTKHSTTFTLVGLGGVLITTPGFNDLFNALPLHNLLWPLRFLGIASFLLLLAVLWRLQGWWARTPLFTTGLIVLMAVDMAGSLPLIYLRPLSNELVQVATRLATTPGWREATLDKSRLGSAAAYAFTKLGQREQIYGWAYQAAATAPSVAALNEALVYGAYDYVLDRLTLYGADDVVLLKGQPFTEPMAAALQADGFRQLHEGDRLLLFHRDGSPRAYRGPWRVLGIGRGARLMAMLFPQIIVGTSPYVDDYTPEMWRQYEVVVLSGFAWHDRSAAEQVVVQAAQAGVRVVVDLTGAPQDPLARIPRFLGVWGERVVLDDRPVEVYTGEEQVTLRPFAAPSRLWYTHVPQGLDAEIVTFNYLGERGTVVGSKQVGSARVWFVGLNLSYHALTTNDEKALRLLADVMQLPPHERASLIPVPLADYRTLATGYEFTYTLDEPAWLLVPVASFDGTRLLVDGVPVEARSVETLVFFRAPPGRHLVTVQIAPTPVYRAGRAVSVLGLVVLVMLSLWGWRTPRAVKLQPREAWYPWGEAP